MKENRENPLNLKSLNHISILCRSVDESLDFYKNVLGFFQIKRPNSFNFDGAWLFNYGIGIHLLQSEDSDDMPMKFRQINPKDNHISFEGRIQPSAGQGCSPVWQCENMGAVETKLKEMEIEYLKSRVEEGGIYVDQLFFHDPNGSMIEICNCDNIPIIPLSGDTVQSCSRIRCNVQQ